MTWDATSEWVQRQPYAVVAARIRASSARDFEQRDEIKSLRARAERAEQEVERLKRGNQERETPQSGDEVEASEA